MRGLGTIVNVLTVVAGTAVGLVLGARLPERIRVTTLTGIGLVVAGVGIEAFLDTHNAVFPIVAIVLGGVLGELADLEGRLEGLGEALRRRFERDPADPRPHSFVERERNEVELPPAPDEERRRRFVEGFVTASLTFCIGPLTIIGSLEDGISGEAELLIVKAALDGLVAIVYASAYGWGVGFSALIVGAVQGLLTVLGVLAGDDVLNARMIDELSATGGVMILGIALRLLDLRAVRVASYLPGLVIAPVLVALFAR